MTKRWRIESKAEGATLYLYGEIWEGDARRILLELQDLTAEVVHLRINSPGGDALEGMTLYNLLRRWASEQGVQITAHIDGHAMSAATVVACGASRVLMAANALYMIHNPWSYGAGDAESLRKEAEVLDKLAQQMAAIYAHRTGRPSDEMLSMMDDTVFLNAEEALEFGFVDELENSLEVAAKYDPTRFASRPLAQDNTTKEDTMTEQEMAKRLAEASAETDALRTDNERLKAAAAREAAAAEVDGLIAAGRLLPERRALALRLHGTDPEALKALVESEPVEKLKQATEAAFESVFNAALAAGKALPAQKDFARAAFNVGQPHYEAWLKANKVPNLDGTTVIGEHSESKHDGRIVDHSATQ